jgi:hypothetical protein
MICNLSYSVTSFFLSFLSGRAWVPPSEDGIIVTLDDLRLCASLVQRAVSMRKSLIGDDRPVPSSSRLGPVESRLAFLKSLSWAKGTWSNLRCQIQAYLLFCFFFEIEPFPPEDSILARFASFLSFTFRTADAISSYVSGVRSVYRFAFLKDPPSSGPEYALTLRGFRRLVQHRVRPVDGLFPEDLVRMASVVHLETSKGKALWAAVLIGFFTFFRSSTLVPKTRRLSNSSHLLRSDISIQPGCLHVSLRFSKTRQFNDTLLVYPIQELPESPCCPVKAWRSLVETSPAAESDPAFTWKSGSFLYYSLFSEELQNLVSFAGVDKYIRPHSLRRGGASTALKIGVSPTLIKLQGDWSSDAWMRYLEIGRDQRLAVSSALGSCFQ